MLNEPSVVAIETINGVSRVRAVGRDAKPMMERQLDRVKLPRLLMASCSALRSPSDPKIARETGRRRKDGGRSRPTGPIRRIEATILKSGSVLYP